MTKGYPNLKPVTARIKRIAVTPQNIGGGGTETGGGVIVPKHPPKGHDFQYSVFSISDILQKVKVKDPGQLAFTVDRTGIEIAAHVIIGIAILSKRGEQLYSTLNEPLEKSRGNRATSGKAPKKESYAFSPEAASKAAQFFKSGNLLVVLTEPVKGPGIALGTTE